MKDATMIGCKETHMFCYECLNQYYGLEGIIEEIVEEANDVQHVEKED